MPRFFISMRSLKALIVLLAIGSVIALYFATQGVRAPLVRISAIRPEMNFARVRVEGVVTNYASVAPQDGYLSFVLNEAATNQSIRVQAYRAVLPSLLSAGNVPVPGDRVSAEGTLRIRDDEPSLTINDASALEIARAEPRAIALNDIGDVPILTRISTQAQVRKIRTLTSAARALTMRDGNAEVDVLQPMSAPELYGEFVAPQIGEWLALSGTVGEFRAQRQILLTNAKDLTRLPLSREFDFRAIANLLHEPAGQWVAARGTVTQINITSQLARITLSDADQNKITVTMFDAWHSVPFSQTLRVGDTLSAQGLLTEFRGAREIQPEIAADVRNR